MNTKTLSTAALLSVVLSACAGSTAGSVAAAGVVLPKDNGTLEVRTYGETEALAMSRASTKAQEACGGTNSYVVLSDSVQFKGAIDPQTGAVIESVSRSVGILTGKNYPTNTSLETDYEAKLVIRCKS